MTKTYNDIDAVSRLLQEKERDLELAARIGQSLLEQNKDLRQKNETLEQEFTIANDTVDHLTYEVLAATERVTQLRHELSLKTGLLQIYSQDMDTDSEAGTPVKEKSFIANWETLQKKIQNLEDENVELRTEASHRMDDIEEVEKKELQLIGDCVRELGDANMQLNNLKEELAKKNEDSVRQQEEITQLLSQVVDLQRKNRMLVAENSDLQNKLLIVRECQNELSQELIEIKEKYGELLAAFQELQDETRKSARRNTLPRNSGMWPYGTSSPYLNPDSLASELESSVGRESDGYGSDERTSQSKRIFETVKCANGSRFVRQKRSQASGSSSALSPTYTSCFNPGTSSKFSSFGQLSSISSHLASDTESAYADSYHTDDESLYSSFGSASVQPPQPASNLAQELEAALKDKCSGTLSRRDIFSARCGSPDSSVSGRSSSLGGPLTYYAQQGATNRNFHLPEKLQIVKPLEGSQTLHHWQRLATPHLGALFEVRQGVQVKGGDKPEKVPEPETYSLSDYEEEDDEEYTHPGKSFMDTGSIYTFTNSTIMHPSDHTLVTPSYPVLQLSTRIVSEPPSSLHSPQTTSSRLKDRGATSTFSTTQGLAKLLNERGIHGMVPTVINSKTEKMVSPPPTPAPSPENSPPPSPPPYSPVRVLDLLTGVGEGPTSTSHIAKGAHLLRTKSQRRKKATANVSGDESANSVFRESKSQQTILSINLLEKLSRIGLENIMATTAASVYHRSTALGRSSRTKVNLRTIDDDAPLTVNSNNVTVLETLPKLTNGGSDRPIPTVLPVICGSEEIVIARKPDSLSDSGISEELSDDTRNNSSNRQWGYVPSVMKSPASIGGVAPPLSYMPNPMLQLNCLRPSGRSPDVGTVGTLRILRKGGYS